MSLQSFIGFFLFVMYTTNGQSSSDECKDLSNAGLTLPHICLHSDLSYKKGLVLYGNLCEESSASAGCATTITTSQGQRLRMTVGSAWNVPGNRGSCGDQNYVEFSEERITSNKVCGGYNLGEELYITTSENVAIQYKTIIDGGFNINFQAFGCKNEEIISGSKISVVSGNYSYGQDYTAQIICDEGHLIKDTNNTNITDECEKRTTAEGDNYTWTGAVKQCEAAYCFPKSPVNGSYVPQQLRFPFGELITYKCDTGFRLNGSSHSRCTITDGLGAHWDSQLPQCDKNDDETDGGVIAKVDVVIIVVPTTVGSLLLVIAAAVTVYCVCFKRKKTSKTDDKDQSSTELSRKPIRADNRINAGYADVDITNEQPSRKEVKKNKQQQTADNRSHKNGNLNPPKDQNASASKSSNSSNQGNGAESAISLEDYTYAEVVKPQPKGEVELLENDLYDTTNQQ